MTKPELEKLLEHVRRPMYKIEADLGMPMNTLQRAIKGTANFPKKWVFELKEYVKTGEWITANAKDGRKPPRRQQTGQNSTQTEKTEKDVKKEEPPKNEGNKPECPDPKKDRAGWAKWMREHA